MQLKIDILLEEPLVLPINYQHILQAIIYTNIEDGNGLSFLYHEQGALYEKRKYKLFTFGALHGKYKVIDKRITFYEQMNFEVRALDEYFLFQLQKNLIKNGITFGDRVIKTLQVQLLNFSVETDTINIYMDSPICVYETKENGFTNYFEPWSDDFVNAVSENFVRKYYAEYDELPNSTIWLEPLVINKNDKYITRYKNIHICGWKGKYQLTGEPEYLDFLYQTGLGSKNAQGFGMYRIDKREHR